MMWQKILDEYSSAIREHDTMKLAIYLLKILKLEEFPDFRDFETESTRLDFGLINREIAKSRKAWGGGGKGRRGRDGDGDGDGDDYFQKLFLLSMDLLVSNKSGDTEAQIKCQIELINLLSRKLLDDPSFYLTPIIVIVKNLRLAVFRSYREECETVDHFTNSIQRPFKVLISNKSETKINVSAVHLFASNLFSIYFRYNKLNAVTNLYKVLSNTLLSERFDAAHSGIDMVPILPTTALFHYYVGLSLLVQSNFAGSFHHFQLADTHNGRAPRNTALADTHNRPAPRNRALADKIAFYLLPLSYLLHKRLPSAAFFRVHPDLSILRPLFDSLRSLDAPQFLVRLQHYRPLLLHFRIYAVYIRLLAVLQLQCLVLTYTTFQRLTASAKPHIVPVSVFAALLRLPDAHAECLLCRFIADRKINGYISHSLQMVVFSKTNPFP